MTLAKLPLCSGGGYCSSQQGGGARTDRSEQNKQIPKGLNERGMVMFLMGVARERESSKMTVGGCESSPILGREEEPAKKI